MFFFGLQFVIQTCWLQSFFLKQNFSVGAVSKLIKLFCWVILVIKVVLKVSFPGQFIDSLFGFNFLNGRSLEPMGMKFVFWKTARDSLRRAEVWRGEKSLFAIGRFLHRLYFISVAYFLILFANYDFQFEIIELLKFKFSWDLIFDSVNSLFFDKKESDDIWISYQLRSVW